MRFILANCFYVEYIGVDDAATNRAVIRRAMKSPVHSTKYTAVKVNDRKKRITWIMDPKLCVTQLLNQCICIPILVFRHCPFSHAILQCSECMQNFNFSPKLAQHCFKHHRVI